MRKANWIARGMFIMTDSTGIPVQICGRGITSMVALVGAVLLAGCSTYVVVETDATARLSTQATTLPAQAFSLPIDSPRRSGTSFETPTSRWTIGTTARGLGGGVTNTGTESICIEFQNGRIGADGNRELRPWPTIGALFVLGNTPTRVGWLPPKLPVISLNEICIPPGQRLQFGVTLEPTLVNGEITLFGARRGPDLAESVKGRTLIVELPFRVGASKDVIRFEWTAVSAFIKLGS